MGTSEYDSSNLCCLPENSAIGQCLKTLKVLEKSSELKCIKVVTNEDYYDGYSESTIYLKSTNWNIEISYDNHCTADLSFIISLKILKIGENKYLDTMRYLSSDLLEDYLHTIKSKLGYEQLTSALQIIAKAVIEIVRKNI
ncbi:hypothetical protein KA977_14620 [Candidatus Dependentiae bacterium]|nr:hypothetical protein [Candidatus Dependentiae bacterium]